MNVKSIPSGKHLKISNDLAKELCPTFIFYFDYFEVTALNKQKKASKYTI